MIYRGVVDKDNNLIVVSIDKNQTGDYNKIGTWCDFTFTTFPEISEDASLFNAFAINILPLVKVVNKTLVPHTLADIRKKVTKKERDAIDIQVTNHKLKQAEKELKDSIKPEKTIKVEETLLTDLQTSLKSQIEESLAKINAVKLSVETIETDIQSIKDAVNILTPETALEELQTKTTEIANSLTNLRNKV
jgi:hypothetical protein